MDEEGGIIENVDNIIINVYSFENLGKTVKQKRVWGVGLISILGQSRWEFYISLRLVGVIEVENGCNNIVGNG